MHKNRFKWFLAETIFILLSGVALYFLLPHLQIIINKSINNYIFNWDAFCEATKVELGIAGIAMWSSILVIIITVILIWWKISKDSYKDTKNALKEAMREIDKENKESYKKTRM